MAAVAPSEPSDPELQATAWDLEPLVSGEGPSGVESRLNDALVHAQAFASRYAGKLDALDGEGLREAMEELGGIYELIGRAGTYAALRFSADTADPANGALLQKAQEQATAIETTLLFFDLEWAALPQERAEELLAGEGLDFCRHHLETFAATATTFCQSPRRRFSPRRSLTGAGAWARLFEELTSAIEVELPDADGAGGGGEKVALDVALSRLSLPDREVRRDDGRGRHRRPGPGPAHACVRVQHAARRQGDR